MDENHHMLASTTAPEAYWDGWWEKIGKHSERVFRGRRFVTDLRSIRTGVDAELDAAVLRGRAGSGLHYVATWQEDQDG